MRFCTLLHFFFCRCHLPDDRQLQVKRCHFAYGPPAQDIAQRCHRRLSSACQSALSICVLLLKLSPFTKSFEGISLETFSATAEQSSFIYDRIVGSRSCRVAPFAELLPSLRAPQSALTKSAVTASDSLGRAPRSRTCNHLSPPSLRLQISPFAVKSINFFFTLNKANTCLLLPSFQYCRQILPLIGKEEFG